MGDDHHEIVSAVSSVARFIGPFFVRISLGGLTGESFQESSPLPSPLRSWRWCIMLLVDAIAWRSLHLHDIRCSTGLAQSGWFGRCFSQSFLGVLQTSIDLPKKGGRKPLTNSERLLHRNLFRKNLSSFSWTCKEQELRCFSLEYITS